MLNLFNAGGSLEMTGFDGEWFGAGRAPVLLKEVKVGDLSSVRDVPAAVFPDNRLQVGLLGMSFLSKLSRFEVRLVLKQ